jgi:hypothetical protein
MALKEHEHEVLLMGKSNGMTEDGERRMQNVADITNPESGKTYREENNSLKHKIPVGTLVKVDDTFYAKVFSHNRDCDGTPLYTVVRMHDGGYAEEQLKVVDLKL